MSLHRVASVIRFEIQRTVTLARLLWWVALAAFPAGIVLLLVIFGGPVNQSDFWVGILFTLIPIIVCMLGLLLWATPVIQAEVEGNTWTFLAVRPHAKVSVLFGKYITAVGWTVLAGWFGLTISLVIAQPDRALHIGTVLAVLILLSAISYGALYTFIGVIAHKRPMIVAVTYTLLMEFLVGWIPAIINQFTVQFRLRTLLLRWYDWKQPPDTRIMEYLAGSGPAVQHILILLLSTAGLLTLSVAILRQQILVASSSD